MSYKFNPFTSNFDEVNDAGGGITELTSDVTAGPGSGSQAATIANNAVTNAKAADMATQTIKGRTTAGSGDPEDLTAAQATAILDNLVGDSGSGGTKGLAPAPAAGDTAANKFLKADGTFKAVDDLNLMSSENRDAEVSIGTWAAYANAASSEPTDMTGGSPNTTITRTTTAGEILRGAGSFKLTKSSGASRQGEGVSASFTVPAGYQGKNLIVKFPFKVVSGSVVDGDFKVFVYDVTNSVLLVPNSNSILGASNTLIASFTSSASATTPADQTYRVGIHIASATDSSVQIAFDDVQIIQDTIASGGIVSPWYTYTPALATVATYDSTITAVTKATTGITVDRVAWRRVGPDMELSYTYSATNTTGGSETAGDILVPMPPGTSIDLTIADRIDSTFFTGGLYNRGTILGQGIGKNSGTLNNAEWCIYPYNANYLSSHVRGQNDFWSTTQVGLRNAGGTVSVTFRATIPVAGWQATNSVSAADQFYISNLLSVGTRVTATPASLGEYRTYQKTSSSFAGTDNAPTTGPTLADGMRIFSVPYASAGAAGQTNRWEIFIGKNKVPKLIPYANAGRTGNIDIGNDFGTLTYGLMNSYDPTTGVMVVDTMTQFSSTTSRYVGTTLPTAGGAYGQPSDCYFDILVSEKVNSITFEESPSARYYSSSTSISGSLATIVWTTKDYDTHSAMSSGIYTIPVNGKYQINSMISNSIGGGASSYVIDLQLQKNGSVISRNNTAMPASTANGFVALVSDIINCAAGDTIRIQYSNTGNTPSISASSSGNYISIVKVG
jgi:hypothetical protein